MQDKAHSQHAHEHQPNGQRDDRELVSPQGELVHMLCLVKEQGRYEQEQKHACIYLHASQVGHEDGDEDAQRNLKQRQAKERKRLV